MMRDAQQTPLPPINFRSSVMMENVGGWLCLNQQTDSADRSKRAVVFPAELTHNDTLNRASVHV